MVLSHNSKPPNGMVFCFDGLNPKCYSGSGSQYTEMISQTTVNAVINSSSLGLDSTLGNPHLRFQPSGTATTYIPFPVDLYGNNGVYVPVGSTGSWSWWQYFEDQGNIDHPNFGWETGSGWDGNDGFVFGSGWGSDGPRLGIASTSYDIYSAISTTNQSSIWQNWTVTFDGNATNGLKTYLNGILMDERTPITKIITGEDNLNKLFVGATNNRGGNWGGYMDIVQMWDRPLSTSEVLYLHNIYKGRFF